MAARFDSDREPYLHPGGDGSHRIAVITDVHGNLAALEACLDAIRWIDVDAVYCGGDLVGYGPHPDEVCELVRAAKIPTIYGSYDYAIGRDLADCDRAYETQDDRDLGERSVAWTLQHTSPASKEFLRTLPFELRFELAGKRVRMVHASPRRVTAPLFGDESAETLERLAADADCDVLLFGHTHRPWVRECGGVLFVNCGSAGKPQDGDVRAAFALLEAEGKHLSVSIERIPYDADAVARELAEVGLPSELAEELVAAV